MKNLQRATGRNVVLAASIVFALAGCGKSGPQPVPVKGSVTYAGKPVSTGTVMFVPTSPGPSATGDIQTDGTYKLDALPGQYAVSISAMEFPSGADGAGVPLLPAKYSSDQSSGLTAEVKPQGDNVADFNLEEVKAKKK